MDHLPARPAIRKLAADSGPLQLSLFDEQDLADHQPGLSRRAADRLPQPAAGRRARPQARGPARRNRGPAGQGRRPGRQADPRRGQDQRQGRAGGEQAQDRKHLILDISEDHLAWRRDQAAIDAEAALDGIYVIRTPLPAAEMDAPATVTAYRNLAFVERDFRSMKADDLDLRPIHHWLEDRVRAHVLICMLAAYLAWHLRRTLAPLTYTDEQPAARGGNPVAPARRSRHASIKAAAHASADGQALRSFRGLLDHLATLTRNTITIGGASFEKITDPTPTPSAAPWSFIGTPIPLTLTL